MFCIAIYSLNDTLQALSSLGLRRVRGKWQLCVELTQSAALKDSIHQLIK